MGRGRRFRRPDVLRQGARRQHRGDQLQPVPGRGLQARLAHPPRRPDPGQGGATPRRLHRDHAPDRLDRPQIWLPDGTNYAGQDALRARQDRLADSLHQIYAALDDDQRLLLEYKFFEPYFYTMDIPDWGTSVLHCIELGERAAVVLDTGHHAPGTNIEFIVMQLLRLGRLGAFDFNSRNYADDDLIAGAADPFQLFRILAEITSTGAHRPESGVNFMLDQCHNIEDKIQGQIRSVLNIEQALAKALLVDAHALDAAQRAVTSWAPTPC